MTDLERVKYHGDHCPYWTPHERAIIDVHEKEDAAREEMLKLREEQALDRYRDRNKARNRVNALEDELTRLREALKDSNDELAALREAVRRYIDAEGGSGEEMRAMSNLMAVYRRQLIEEKP